MSSYDMLRGRREEVAAELETHLRNDDRFMSLTAELARLDDEIKDEIKAGWRRQTF